MGHTFTKLYIHGVFATRARDAWFVDPAVRARVLHYIGGIASEHDYLVMAVGGWIEHVHILFELPKTRTVPEFMKTVKANSSKWLRKAYPKNFSRFAWQEGYSAFSVSASQLDRVGEYIENQEERHSRRDRAGTTYGFLDEMRSFAYKHGIEFRNEDYG